MATCNLIGIAAAAALLGGYGGRPIAQASDGWDGEESRLKREALEAACTREREAMRLDAERRARERQQRLTEANARKAEDFDKLRRGIDPTNGHPLSRQQRRALNRRNFPFLNDGSAIAQTPSEGL